MGHFISHGTEYRTEVKPHYFHKKYDLLMCSILDMYNLIKTNKVVPSKPMLKAGRTAEVQPGVRSDFIVNANFKIIPQRMGQ